MSTNEQVRYRPQLAVGTRVLFSHKYAYKEGMVVDAVLDTSSRWSPDTEFYVFYKVQPDALFLRSRWMRGDDVKGKIGAEPLGKDTILVTANPSPTTQVPDPQRDSQ